MNILDKPVPRLAPSPPDPALDDIFARFAAACGGSVPNAMLIMQRRPRMLRAFVEMTRAVSDPETDEVDLRLKRLVALIASHAAGCRYCTAHNAALAVASGVEDPKLAAVWEYATSPLYSEAERIALDVALAAGSVPNGVTDEMFARLREHWSANQIVEIVAVIALFGFLNRWNDTFATPIENWALALGEKYLGPEGWDSGKHMRRG